MSIDGVTKVHKKNDNPTMFKDVKVYAGYGSNVANAEIREDSIFILFILLTISIKVFFIGILLPASWKNLLGVWTPVWPQLVHPTQCTTC